MITSDGCFNYGINHGCDECCPVLQAGECKNVEDALTCCDLTFNEKQGIKYNTLGTIDETRTTHSTRDT